MRTIINDAAFVIFLTAVTIGITVLFVKVVKSTGSDYADHLRKMRATKEASASYLERNLAGIERQNALLERIADALDRANPPPPADGA
jgi:hypothetical protein